MYIRIKRHKTTYFIQCDPIETTLDIKQKLATLIDQPLVDQRLILVGSGEVLEDTKTLADQKVGLNSYILLHLVINYRIFWKYHGEGIQQLQLCFVFPG